MIIFLDGKEHNFECIGVSSLKGKKSSVGAVV